MTVILNNTQTIDTILSWMEDAVGDTSAVGFTGLVFIINTGIAFIIPSSWATPRWRCRYSPPWATSPT